MNNYPNYEYFPIFSSNNAYVEGRGNPMMYSNVKAAKTYIGGKYKSKTRRSKTRRSKTRRSKTRRSKTRRSKTRRSKTRRSKRRRSKRRRV